MKVVPHEYPPLIEEIDAAFHVKGRPILFAWGDLLFNPMSVPIPPSLMAHEAVHGMRQKAYVPVEGLPVERCIEFWWHRYIADPTFRLAEEIPAHAAEFWHLAAHGNRNMRRAGLVRVATRLSGPLYGHMITRDKAKRVIKSMAEQIQLQCQQRAA